MAKATKDIPYIVLGEGRTGGGVIRKGTVGGQHFEWTAWSDGQPLIVYHFLLVDGSGHRTQKWDLDSRYQVVIEGDPPLEVRLMARPGADGVRPFLGAALDRARSAPRRCRRRLRCEARCGYAHRPGHSAAAGHGAAEVGRSRRLDGGG